MRHDSDALTLFLSHRGELLDYASTIVGDRARAEDVVQEAWLRFGSAAENGAVEEPVGFLYRVVRNLAIDGRRRRTRELRVVDSGLPAERADSYPSPEAEAAGREELRLLREALAELPERTRIALEMRRFGGLKLREIAVHLGISVTVAHELVARAIAHCRDRVRPATEPRRKS
jgi:RNA polymerase sigma factor (sigma-70 family)